MGMLIFNYTTLITNSSNKILNNRYQIGGFARRSFRHFRLFPHVRNLDALQHGLDALVDFSQGFADVATIALTALAPNRDARGNKERSVDGLDHFKGGNRVRCSRQPVTTVRAMMRLQ